MMRLGCPPLKLRQRHGSLGPQNLGPRRSQCAGRRGSRQSSRGGWGRRIWPVSCRNSAVSSGEAWPCWLPLPLWHSLTVRKTHKARINTSSLSAPTSQPHWGEKKSVSQSVLILYEGHPSDHMTPVSCMDLQWHKCGALHGCTLQTESSWGSVCVPTNSPTPTTSYRAMAWKVSGSKWKMIAQCRLTPVISLYRDATTALQWHFLPRCAEGRRLFTSWAEILRLCGAGYSPRHPGKNGCESPSAVKTHTHKKKINKHSKIIFIICRVHNPSKLCNDPKVPDKLSFNQNYQWRIKQII